MANQDNGPMPTVKTGSAAAKPAAGDAKGPSADQKSSGMGPKTGTEPLGGPQPVRGNSPKPVEVSDEVKNLMEYAGKGNPVGVAKGADPGSSNQKPASPGYTGK